MRFVFRPVLLVTGALAFAILIGLGTWQVQRLQWKTDLIEKVEARADAAPVPVGEALARLEAGKDIAYLPVAVRGGFPSERTAHVFGTLEGAPGYYAFQTMALDDGSGRLLLVNRGFVPQDDLAGSYPLPDAERMTGLVRFYGGASGIAKAVAPPGRGEEGIFFDRDAARIAAYLTPDATAHYLPFAIDSTLPTALPRGGTTRIDFRNAHLGYAITWYGLAAGLAFMVAAMSRKPDDAKG